MGSGWIPAGVEGVESFRWSLNGAAVYGKVLQCRLGNEVQKGSSGDRKGTKSKLRCSGETRILLMEREKWERKRDSIFLFAEKW